ncbi:hypothetical protein COU88_02025 [Candidatus Roizmanbacteria bacterium CG10_big_fil_rev_8_21_14_0_10_39_6]|uniref:Mur ligase central domain-containing protein n=1 Tax=Candidatus Roizmanbacteria bacterium CG10_big_fil_rev_8_21_14_0_10_39_6 TaxID=1974853 RepID=A0A2M8KSU6_9BACT|nr:MAG: hypothetical protein COU88_02025 [Candidatus Roizmanbacteria bacterium CG10_big_fil_rev_8_21_14_0_10_39_6]
MSIHLSKLFKNIYPFSDFLYLLQLEEYDSGRYFRLLPRFFWRRNIQNRGKLDITNRIKIIYILSFPVSLVIPFLIPIVIGIVNVISKPAFDFAHSRLRSKAATYFRNHGGKTKVVAIAGSYGKTSTRIILYNLLKYHFRVQTPPGNINTPTGIAEWILKEFKTQTEILIIEVDTYFCGEIAESLNITPPDISVLTTIGDQHLERFQTKENLELALMEIFEYAKEGVIQIRGTSENADAAVRIARHFKIPEDIIRDVLKKNVQPGRRGDIIKFHNFSTIDNSYNISEQTATNTLKKALLFAKECGKKLIVITAGIPELGRENANANKHIGMLINKQADVVIILRSIFYEDIRSQISKSELQSANSMQEVVKILSLYAPSKYILLLFPELTDAYY